MMTQDDDPILPEYAENPFIARLPPILSPAECLMGLRALPRHDDQERLRPAHERIHFLGRLLTYFDPNERHLALEQRIDLMIRQGYLGRNPLTTSYYHRLRNDHARMAARDITAVAVPMTSTASSLTLLGVSGMGKSLSVTNILNRYPETIDHDGPVDVIQVPWVRLECPYKGSVKQLCLSFFNRMDDLLGTDFAHRHGGARSSIDNAVLQMAAIANRHAVGIIVIDEIQHLMEARGTGRDEMLNFLVTLVNHCSTPVMLIGTPKALPLLQGAFRQARRASGLGNITWDRMPRGKTWDRFVSQLWSCQWTRVPSPLTDELCETLYDESQGIIDIVIKLYMLAQMRVISFASMQERPERLDAALLRRTAREHLGLIRPMIEALRSGDERKLRDYDDLQFFDAHVQDAMQASFAEIASNGALSDLSPPKPRKSTAEDKIVAALTALGVGHEQAGLLVREAEARYPEADPAKIRLTVLSMLKAEDNADTEPVVPVSVAAKEDVGDLRQYAADGDTYTNLYRAGTVKRPAEDACIQDPALLRFRQMTGS